MILGNMPEAALVMLALSISAAVGLAIGAVRLRGVGLGVAGVLFAGIAVGHFASAAGLHLDAATLEFVRELGLIVFVFSIGLQVGPGFFQSLHRSGLRLNLLAVAVVLVGVAVTAALTALSGVPAAVMIGLMSGAVTNTPGLGAATQVLKDMGADAATQAMPSIGYAVAYPFGIVGIILSMLALRFVLKIDIGAEAQAFEANRKAGVAHLPDINVRVTNPNLDGLSLGEIPDLFDHGVAPSRMLSAGELILPVRGTVVHVGDLLHLVGPAERLRDMCLILGEKVDAPLSTRGTKMAWDRIAVTDRRAFGRRIRSLGMEAAYGVTISRVFRSGTELVGQGDLALQFGDIVTVVGPPAGIEAAKRLLGDQRGSLDQTPFAAIFLGIALGVILGSIPIAAPGLPAPLKLGLAGGPLVAAILLARLGSVGPFVWFMPPVASHALREFGIILFLAVVGIRAGDHFIATLLGGEGLVWIGYGAVITLAPLLIVGFFARLVLRTDYLSLCGVMAGSMTDPPALAFASALNPSPAAPIAYATVYPLTMCLRILAPQVLMLAFL